MTHSENYELSSSMVEELSKNGRDVIHEFVRVNPNNVKQTERSNDLHEKYTS